MLQTEKIPRKKVSEIVVEQIEEWIRTGKVAPAEKLPSVRELCDLFGVGRSSVRDALTTLKGKGIVHVKHGEGTFVCHTDTTTLIPDVLLLRENDINKLYQVRKILEVGIVEMAALNRSASQLKAMKLVLDKLVKATTVKGWEADYQFHQKIADACGNTILIDLMKTVSTLMKKGMMDCHRIILADRKLASAIIEQHVAIYRAVEAGDATKASEAMFCHLTSVEELLHRHVEGQKGGTAT
ncbi:GntR family transcriptional regulator [Lentibacillus populi]|uniref:GntR family transcriptional regulator n=1 Tax=Lentibacillus populi TaxID=1827502 RepID=A0A9W5X7M7_9BACI|nr:MULTISPECIES: FadR/GntR family transcriptional regulator [Bacillaceae]MBT2216275.1 FadR family transcriptional regulator [Virgibacillus dakarensis]GGB57565.1 GntR family transcriptional regulator [Lentibacillus populi]